MPRLIAVLLVSLGLLALPQAQLASVAQESAVPPFEQVQLTPDMVKRFLASFAEIKKVGKKYEAQSDRFRATRRADPWPRPPAYMRNKQARAEIENILQANGFSDFREWSKVGQSVGLAYGFAKSKRSPQELQQQAEQAIALIRKNDRFTRSAKGADDRPDAPADGRHVAVHAIA